MVLRFHLYYSIQYTVYCIYSILFTVYIGIQKKAGTAPSPERMSSSGWLRGSESSALISSTNAAAPLQSTPSTSQHSHHWHSLSSSLSDSSEFRSVGRYLFFFTTRLKNFPLPLTETRQASDWPSELLAKHFLTAEHHALLHHLIAANLV